jgi:hypothetical protein
MIKALSTPNAEGQRVLILGLSDENWARLRTGANRSRSGCRTSTRRCRR